MENPPFEDVFPIGKRWISIARLVFQFQAPRTAISGDCLLLPPANSNLHGLSMRAYDTSDMGVLNASFTKTSDPQK